jgi:hypothetical protein
MKHDEQAKAAQKPSAMPLHKYRPHVAEQAHHQGPALALHGSA